MRDYEQWFGKSKFMKRSPTKSYGAAKKDSKILSLMKQLMSRYVEMMEKFRQMKGKKGNQEQRKAIGQDNKNMKRQVEAFKVKQCV